jgi:hypothetical protein
VFLVGGGGVQDPFSGPPPFARPFVCRLSHGGMGLGRRGDGAAGA